MRQNVTETISQSIHFFAPSYKGNMHGCSRMSALKEDYSVASEKLIFCALFFHEVLATYISPKNDVEFENCVLGSDYSFHESKFLFLIVNLHSGCFLKIMA